MSNLKTINVNGFFDVPKNFTGIIKSDLNIPKNFTGIVKYPNGTKHWYKNGKIHRKDGPAIIKPDGTKFWFKDEKLHRKNGPAIEYAHGTKEWYINDKRHREDGPAMEWSNGTKRWYLNDILLSEEQHKLLMMFSEESRQKLYKNDNKGLKNLLAL